MVTWVFRNVPRELDEAVRKEAGVTGQSLRATVMYALCKQFAIGQLANSKQEASKQSPEVKEQKLKKTDAERCEDEFKLPEWVPRVAWGHFEEMRKKIKKPLIDAAKQTALRELEKLRGEGQDPEKVLEQSVYKCWQGLFPVVNGKAGKPEAAVGRQEYDTSGNKATIEAIKQGRW